MPRRKTRKLASIKTLAELFRTRLGMAIHTCPSDRLAPRSMRFIRYECVGPAGVVEKTFKQSELQAYLLKCLKVHHEMARDAVRERRKELLQARLDEIKAEEQLRAVRQRLEVS